MDDVLETIKSRRSIRRFKGDALTREQVERILQAGIYAPSAKNRQPWEFVVLSGKEKEEAVRVMQEGISKEQQTKEVLPGSHQHIGGALYTADIMRRAPVVVFVFDPDLRQEIGINDTEEGFYEMADLQSIGAAVQNMLLEAEVMGIGSLWICDIYFAYQELAGWFGKKGRMVAAAAFGYADEKPGMRPRKKMNDIVTWMGEDNLP